MRNAFVLGNGPTLPDLHVLTWHLNHQLTIGVNRILRTGFTPTAILIADSDVFEEERERLEQTDALVVVTEGLPLLPGSAQVHSWPGFSSSDPRGQDPAWIVLDGSTGSGATRWAMWFADRVFMVGCSGTYAPPDETTGGKPKTDCWGFNPQHRKDAREMFGRERVKVLGDFPGKVLATDDPTIWKLNEPTAQEVYRDEIRAALTKAGARWGE